jgi:hypothetical protein
MVFSRAFDGNVFTDPSCGICPFFDELFSFCKLSTALDRSPTLPCFVFNSLDERDAFGSACYGGCPSQAESSTSTSVLPEHIGAKTKQ